MCAVCFTHYIVDFASLTVETLQIMIHIMQFPLALSEFQIFSLPLFLQHLQFMLLL